MVQSIPRSLQDDAPKASRRVLVAMIAAFATVCVAVAWLWLFAIGSADGPQPAFVLHDDVSQEPAESLSLLPMPTVDVAAELRQLSHEADVLLQQMDADYSVVNSRTDSPQGAP